MNTKDYSFGVGTTGRRRANRLYLGWQNITLDNTINPYSPP